MSRNLLLTKANKAALIRNYLASQKDAKHDPVPVVQTTVPSHANGTTKPPYLRLVFCSSCGEFTSSQGGVFPQLDP